MTNSEQSKRSAPIDFIKKVMDNDLPPDRPAEIALIERLKLGDAEAWQQFVDDWSPRLYNYLKARVPTQEAAEDILNDTLIGLVQAVRTLDNGTSLSTLVYSIALRKVADYRRRQMSRQWDRISPEEASAVGLAMQAGLGELPEQLQHILLMRYHRGYSVDEIAHELGISYKAATSRLQRARQSLHVSMRDTEVSSKRQAPLTTMLQMLLTQQQKCLNLKMDQEADLFQRAIQFLYHLTAPHSVGETT